MQATYRAALKKLIWVAIPATLIFLLGLSSSLTESLYTYGLYPVISIPLRTISSVMPFSAGDLLYLLLIIYLIYCLYNFCSKLIRKQYNRQHRILIPIRLLQVILVLYIAFKLLWGLNYSRPSITAKLGITDKRYDEKELVLLAKFLINKVNHAQAERLKQQPKYPIQKLQAEATAAYHQLAQDNEFFRYRSPTAKPVLNSWIITKIGLEGYYNPLSGEANINMRLPAIDLPFVTSHEMAHQIGVAREDEANLVAYLVSTHSRDANFRYSGYYGILRNVLFEVRLIAPDAYESLYKSINAGTIADFKNGIAFWQQYNNQMFGYMSATLDGFLKINNQHKGIDSYQDIVLWVYNIHEKELKLKTLQP